MNHSYLIKYENINLKPLSVDDIEILRNFRNDAKKNIFFSNYDYITAEQQKSWYDNYLKKQNDIIFSIIINEFIGIISLYNIELNQAEFGRFQIGVNRYSNKGIGLMSIIMILKFGFTFLNLDKIYAIVNKDNLPALINYIKVGFIVVGDLPSNSRYGGKDFQIEINKDRFEKLNNNIMDHIIISSI